MGAGTQAQAKAAGLDPGAHRLEADRLARQGGLVAGTPGYNTSVDASMRSYMAPAHRLEADRLARQAGLTAGTPGYNTSVEASMRDYMAGGPQAPPPPVAPPPAPYVAPTLPQPPSAANPSGFSQVYNPLVDAQKMMLDPYWAEPMLSPAGGALNYGMSSNVLDPMQGPAGGALNYGMSNDVLNPDANPYLQRYGQAMINPIFDTLRESTLPYIRSQAIGAGGRGGSRQALLEAQAVRDATRTAGDALSGLYSQSYGQGLGHQAQMTGLYGQLQGHGLGHQARMTGLYNQMRQGGLQSILSGMGMAPQTINTGMIPGNMLRQLGAEQEARFAGIGGQMANAEQQRLENFMRAVQGNYGGSSSSSGTNTAPGQPGMGVGQRISGGMMGGLGGAMTGAALAGAGMTGFGLPLAAMGALGGFMG